MRTLSRWLVIIVMALLTIDTVRADELRAITFRVIRTCSVRHIDDHKSWHKTESFSNITWDIGKEMIMIETKDGLMAFDIKFSRVDPKRENIVLLETIPRGGWATIKFRVAFNGEETFIWIQAEDGWVVFWCENISMEQER